MVLERENTGEIRISFVIVGMIASFVSGLVVSAWIIFHYQDTLTALK